MNIKKIFGHGLFTRKNSKVNIKMTHAAEKAATQSKNARRQDHEGRSRTCIKESLEDDPTIGVVSLLFQSHLRSGMIIAGLRSGHVPAEK